MGLHAPLVEMMIAEHVYKPIRGDVLFIGRQTVFMNEASFGVALRKYGISLPSNFTYDYDNDTRAALDIPFRVISDRCLMRALGVGNLRFLDVSSYEGAEVIWDLSKPVPENLKNKFDFIFDGSCLDNIFNPAVALMNMAAMLRPGGRLLSIEHASSFNNPYTMFSIGWFSDYFAANRFADFRIYVAGYNDINTLCCGPWHLWLAPKTTRSLSFSPPRNMQTVLISLAEKGETSTYEHFPIQSQYRDEKTDLSRTMEQSVKALSLDRPYFMGITPLEFPDIRYLGEVGNDLVTSFNANLVKADRRQNPISPT